MSIPRVTFGDCKRCGGTGPDDADPGDGNSTSNLDTVGNGYRLLLFRGEYVCDQCKTDILNDEQSMMAAEGHRDEDVFRARAGFEDSIN